jgi:hypothetical protein
MSTLAAHSVVTWRQKSVALSLLLSAPTMIVPRDEDTEEDPENFLAFTYQRKTDTPRTKRVPRSDPFPNGYVLRGMGRAGILRASELALRTESVEPPSGSPVVSNIQFPPNVALPWVSPIRAPPSPVRKRIPGSPYIHGPISPSIGPILKRYRYANAFSDSDLPLAEEVGLAPPPPVPPPAPVAISPPSRKVPLSPGPNLYLPQGKRTKQNSSPLSPVRQVPAGKKNKKKRKNKGAGWFSKMGSPPLIELAPPPLLVDIPALIAPPPPDEAPLLPPQQITITESFAGEFQSMPQPAIEILAPEPPQTFRPDEVYRAIATIAQMAPVAELGLAPPPPIMEPIDTRTRNPPLPSKKIVLRPPAPPPPAPSPDRRRPSQHSAAVYKDPKRYTTEEHKRILKRIGTAMTLSNFTEPPDNLAPATSLHGEAMRQPTVNNVGPLGVPGHHYRTTGGTTFYRDGELAGDTPLYMPVDARNGKIIRDAARQSSRRLNHLHEQIRLDPYALSGPPKFLTSDPYILEDNYNAVHYPRDPIPREYLPNEESTTLRLAPPPPVGRFAAILDPPAARTRRTDFSVEQYAPTSAATMRHPAHQAAIVNAPGPVFRTATISAEPIAESGVAALAGYASLINPAAPSVRGVAFEQEPATATLVDPVSASVRRVVFLEEPSEMRLAPPPDFTSRATSFSTEPTATKGRARLTGRAAIRAPALPRARSVAFDTAPIVAPMSSILAAEPIISLAPPPPLFRGALFSQEPSVPKSGSLQIHPSLPPIVLVRPPNFPPSVTFSLGDLFYSPSAAAQARSSMASLMGSPIGLAPPPSFAPSGNLPDFAAVIPNSRPRFPSAPTPIDYATAEAALPQQPFLYTPTLIQDVKLPTIASRVREAAANSAAGKAARRSVRRHRITMPKKKSTGVRKPLKGRKKATKKKATKKKACKTKIIYKTCVVKPAKKEKKPRKLSQYNLFVRRFSAAHPNLKGPALMCAAAKAYRGSCSAPTTISVCVTCNTTPCCCAKHKAVKKKASKKKAAALSCRRKGCGKCHCHPVKVNVFCGCPCHK